jgi:hypothetical protein
MTVFLDTMVYLHYSSPDETDLPRILDRSQIILVVPRITVRELDKHKSTHPSSKIKDRARRILQLIERWAGGATTVRTGVEFRYYGAAPLFSYSDLGLDPQWSDDVLIATIMQYKSDYPSEEVLLISQDTGPRLTASQHGIAVYQLSEDLRLQTEPDPVELENRELKKTIERLQRALPQLTVFFKGSEPPQSYAKYSLPKPSELTAELVTAQINQLRAKHPKINPPNRDSIDDGSVQVQLIRAIVGSSDLYQIPSEEYERYNSEIEQFYGNYEQYLHNMREYDARNKRTISFTIQIANTGTAPAEDVDASILFPNGFVLAKKRPSREPEKPALPVAPQSKMQQLAENMNRSLASYISPPITPHFAVPTSFSLRRTNSYEVTDRFERIKHGFTASLPKLYLTFESYENACSFSCKYVLSSGNLPSSIEGELNFVISKDTTV